MFGLKKLFGQYALINTYVDQLSIKIAGLTSRVEQLESTSRELVENASHNNHDLSIQSTENVKSFCELATKLLKLEEKVNCIENRSKPGRKPKVKEEVVVEKKSKPEKKVGKAKR